MMISRLPQLPADPLAPLPQYAMYLRKSRADMELEAIGQEETLARHRAMLFALARRHNIAPEQIEIFHEIVSGDSIDARPEVQRLLQNVYAQKYRGVLVVEVERLARGNTRDQGEVADAFTFSGTLIITPAKVYDPGNEFDQEYFEFGLFMSRREYKTICRRLETGKLQSVQEGNFLAAMPPYGYSVVRTSKKDRYLVEEPQEADIVRQIFRWYTEELRPAAWIARELTLMGVPTRRNSREWSATHIARILRNPHYTGMIAWGRDKTVKTRNTHTGKIEKKRKICEEYQLFPGKHVALIPQAQFDMAQSLYGAHAPVKPDRQLVNPLAGLLLCARCGRAIGFSRFQDGRISRYFHKQGVYACRMKSLQAPVVIDALAAALALRIATLSGRIQSARQSEEVPPDSRIAALEAELARQEKMKQRLFESWEADDGTYTKSEFLERKQIYTQAIRRLQAELEAYREPETHLLHDQKQLDTLHALLRCIRDDDMDAGSKNAFLKQFVEKITFDTIDLGPNQGGEAILEIFLT